MYDYLDQNFDKSSTVKVDRYFLEVMLEVIKGERPVENKKEVIKQFERIISENKNKIKIKLENGKL